LLKVKIILVLHGVTKISFLNTLKNKNNPEFQVQRYTASHKAEWNDFITSAKNATFLFNRNFMDYHNDRFEDFSLLIFKKNKLVALLPANKKENEAFSHQGLTYGGLVLSRKIKFTDVTLLFSKMLEFLNENKVEKLHIKLLPAIYHSIPSEEIHYLLQLVNAKRSKVMLASVVNCQNPLKIQSNRIEGVKKAQKNQLIIKEEQSFKPFWNEILKPNLKSRFDSEPVHSLDEIRSLANNFPKNIHQFTVYKENEIVAGVTIFETETLVHTQYISANNDKQKLGSLDFLLHYLLTDRFKHKKYFDFGTSNEEAGAKINEGLQYWKECFGGRSVVYEQYFLETKNYTLLNSVFI
jgi:hypothetical protein|tara:strand:- start:13949 stop:15004 length:1056 start_codon:yes stop_codon:yes gene_type:complete